MTTKLRFLLAIPCLIVALGVLPMLGCSGGGESTFTPVEDSEPPPDESSYANPPDSGPPGAGTGEPAPAGVDEGGGEGEGEGDAPSEG